MMLRSGRLSSSCTNVFYLEKTCLVRNKATPARRDSSSASKRTRNWQLLSPRMFLLACEVQLRSFVKSNGRFEQEDEGLEREGATMWNSQKTFCPQKSFCSFSWTNESDNRQGWAGRVADERLCLIPQAHSDWNHECLLSNHVASYFWHVGSRRKWFCINTF